LSRLAGLVTGDGHLGRTAVGFTSGDVTVRQAFGGLARDLFGLEVTVRQSPGKCPTLLAHSSALVEVLNRLYAIPGGAKAATVRAPDWLLSAPEEHIAAYLSGLLDTDGSVVPPGARGRAIVQFCTGSSGLAGDVQALLLRLGVRSHLSQRTRGRLVSVYDPGGAVRLRGLLPIVRPARVAALAAVAPGGGYSAVDVIPGLGEALHRSRLAAGLTHRGVARVLGLSRQTVGSYERERRLPPRQRVLDLARRTRDQALSARLARLASQPVFWDRVVSVRPVRDHRQQYVYDLTVPGTHTFLIGPGGIVAHNTTLLNALGASIAAPAERVVTIEETPELTLERQLPDCVALQARGGNAEGAGGITIRELVRTSLRMRPTRIIVGEVRGAEALDMLLAMHSGHEGAISTIHAHSPRDALDRLVTLAMMAGERLSEAALARMVARTVGLVVQLRAEPATGRRRVAGVFEVTGMEGDVVAGQDLWVSDAATGRLAWSGLRPRCLARIADRGVPYEPPPAAAARGGQAPAGNREVIGK
jgi:DNA-binding XRE family transcriptional regulator